MRNSWWFGLIVAWLPGTPAADAGSDPWFDDDWESRAARVNEGQLTFLPNAPVGVHEHRNVFTILGSSLKDGWVQLEQCHRNLDAVPRSQVLFNRERTRALEITHAGNIERAWVEGHTVQLEGVARQADLCLRAESKALWPDGDGAYTLRNGPFMRRFLDGYYPMVVRLEVRYPCGLLEVAAVHPGRQDGLSVTAGDCAVDLNAAFEGRLNTEIRFLGTR